MTPTELREQFKKETGEPVFGVLNFSKYVTPQYLNWLEARLCPPKQEGVKTAEEIATANQEGFIAGANWQKAQGLFTREDIEKAAAHFIQLGINGLGNIIEGQSADQQRDFNTEFDEFMSSNYPEIKGLESDVKEILENRIKELKSK